MGAEIPELGVESQKQEAADLARQAKKPRYMSALKLCAMHFSALRHCRIRGQSMRFGGLQAVLARLDFSEPDAVSLQGVRLGVILSDCITRRGNQELNRDLRNTSPNILDSDKSNLFSMIRPFRGYQFGRAKGLSS